MDSRQTKPEGFELLFEDGPCLVVSKPAGLLTQAPPGIDSLEVRVQSYLQRRDDRPGWGYLGVPHRIDRPASGALVLASSRRAARRLSEQFEMRLVEKTYWALVSGHVEPATGTWEDFVRKIPGQAAAEVVAAGHPEGRVAVLHYRVLKRQPDTAAAASVPPTPREATAAGWSLLEISLETGRTHQIRLQCGSRGHPILGDEQYGSREPFGPARDDPRDRAIALHARRLAFRHPRGREPVEVVAPLPTYWPDGLA